MVASYSNLKMDAAGSPEMLVSIHQTTRRHIPKGGNSKMLTIFSPVLRY
jgi:hypothetical protein